jgi:uncharacterized protein YjbI with pentapeptide repeats
LNCNFEHDIGLFSQLVSTVSDQNNRLYECDLTGSILGWRELNHTQFKHVTLVNATIIGGHNLSHARFPNFDHCDLRGATFSGTFDRLKIESSDLTGTNFNHAVFRRETNFIGNLMLDTNFSGSKSYSGCLIFDRCNIGWSSFYLADWKNVVRFDQSYLAHTDLRVLRRKRLVYLRPDELQEEYPPFHLESSTLENVTWMDAIDPGIVYSWRQTLDYYWEQVLFVLST